MANIIRRRGDTYPYVIQCVDKCSGDPIDVTGYSFLMAVDPSKEPLSSTNNIAQMTGVITDAVNGIAEFTPDSNEADNVGTFYYDIQWTDTNAKDRTIDSGKYILKQDVAK
jgi:hypothetical protein